MNKSTVIELSCRGNRTRSPLDFFPYTRFDNSSLFPATLPKTSGGRQLFGRQMLL